MRRLCVILHRSSTHSLPGVSLGGQKRRCFAGVVMTHANDLNILDSLTISSAASRHVEIAGLCQAPTRDALTRVLDNRCPLPPTSEKHTSRESDPWRSCKISSAAASVATASLSAQFLPHLMTTSLSSSLQVVSTLQIVSSLRK